MGIEDRALELVVKYEAKNGWKAEDVHSRGLPYDIVSKKGRETKFIEVKATKSRRAYVEVSEAILRKMGRNIGNYHIYNVYDLEKRPKLRIVDPETLFKHLKTWVTFYFRFAWTDIPEIKLTEL